MASSGNINRQIQLVIGVIDYKMFKGKYLVGMLSAHPTGCPKKRPVNLIKRVKIAHSFLTVCVRSVPRYHFKLAYVILQMAIKEFFETHF